MPSAGLLLRLLGVGAFAAAPLAATAAATPDISTGNAIAAPSDGGFQNTGGNVEFGTGQANSTVDTGAPAAAPGLSTLSTPAVPVNPAAAALAHARALIASEKAKAQAEIAAAQAEAAAAVAQAQQQANQARANGNAASAAAQQQAEANAARTAP